jgi:predicted CoA-substrate-specific enzyme activase
MKQYSIGIDSGSTFCKTVLIHNNSIIGSDIRPTGWQPAENALKQIKDLTARFEVDLSQCAIGATGYGRDIIYFADKTITEITCHARGAVFLDNTIGGVLDIGGQDCKVIKISNGKPVDFLMNDKCAAGTGKFLDMVCSRLELDFSEIDKLANLEQPEKINNMCAVFAESEIIGLIAKGKDRDVILGGVLEAITAKVTQMVVRMSFNRDVRLIMTGGLSHIQSLTALIGDKLGVPIVTHDMSVLAGAIGASLAVAPD